MEADVKIRYYSKASKATISYQKKELKVSKIVKPKSDNDDSKNLPKEDFKTKENKKESSKKEN